LFALLYPVLHVQYVFVLPFDELEFAGQGLHWLPAEVLLRYLLVAHDVYRLVDVHDVAAKEFSVNNTTNKYAKNPRKQHFFTITSSLL